MLTQLLNKLTHYFLHRAFAQMERAEQEGTVSTATDDVADFCDDYYTYFVRSNNDED